tara:strand:- start:84 stop:275 length:192 start_codon:yes stop_codon:yes gene_type:complete
MDKDTQSKAKLTNAQTDTESGAEGLPPEEEMRRSLDALKVMHQRGLISDQEYETRKQDFISNT